MTMVDVAAEVPHYTYRVIWSGDGFGEKEAPPTQKALEEVGSFR